MVAKQVMCYCDVGYYGERHHNAVYMLGVSHHDTKSPNVDEFTDLVLPFALFYKNVM